MQIQSEHHGYSLTECIKQDKYSKVYRGQDNEETNFIVKIFNIQLISLRERQRFLQETNLLTSLQHPALLPLLEAGIEKGNPYLIRAYMPEGSLVTQLLQQKDQVFPLSTAMDILTRIGAAVTYLHQKGINHGSIKPENILFDENQQAFLSDIQFTSIHSSTYPTLQTRVIGTTKIEQQIQKTALPDNIKGGIQNDMHALSIIAYELLTGHQPFTSTSDHNVPPVPPSYWTPSLSKEVDSVFSQAFNVDTEARFGSAILFVKALQYALNIPVKDNAPLTKQISASLLQTSTHQLVLFQEQTRARLAGSTKFIGRLSLHNKSFIKRQPNIFSIRPLFAVLAVLLVLIGILVPVFLFHPHSGSPATNTRKAQNQVPTRQTNSITPGHTALPLTPVKHKEPAPLPRVTPKPTPTPLPMPVIVNAGFEFPYLYGDYEYASDNSGWAFSDDCGIAGNGSGLTVNTANAPWGVQVAFVQAHGTMSQNVSFTQGTYRISFLAAQRVDSSSTQSLWVIIDDTVVGSFTPVGGSYLYYTTPSFTVSSGIHTLQFKGLKGGAHNTVFIDSVAVIH